METPPHKKTEELIRERMRVDAELERHLRMMAVLFVDIVGSTRFYEQHGDLAGFLMVQRFLDMLTPAIAEAHGVVVKTIGDAILARFDQTEAAVRCATQMQKILVEWNQHRPAGDQIHIRIGLNTGMGLLKDNDVYGDLVNVASRVVSVSEPDAITISPSVYDEIRSVSDIRVRQKAEGVELKGKSEKLVLYQVIWREGEQAGPAPAPPSKKQLVMATGVHSLEELLRPAAVAPSSASALALQAPAAPAAAVPSKAKGTAVMGIPKAEEAGARTLRFVLAQVHADGSLGERYPIDKPVVTAGREEADIHLPNDPLVAPQHARFTQLGDGVYVEDLSSPQGVFLRLARPHKLKDQDVLLVGRKKLRFVSGTSDTSSKAVSKATQALGSAQAGPSRLVELTEDNQEGNSYPLSGEETVLGRAQGTYTFADDHYMSGTHAHIVLKLGHPVLEDLKSTNGTFVRVRKRVLARDGDTLLIGNQLLRVLAED